MQFFIYCILNLGTFMNKIILAGLISTFSLSSYAVQEQIAHAKSYLDKNQLLNNQYEQNDILIAPESSEANESNYVEIYSDIRLGQKHPAIGKLQEQLELEKTNIYNKELQEIIKEGQRQWGMNVTGIIDQNTWFAFYQQPQSWRNRVAQESVQEWESVLEKHANQKNSKMIIVNIPSQTLLLYERKDDGYHFIMSSPVVVGSRRHQTPFNDLNILSFKYNPTWTPTQNMIRRNLFKGEELNVKWLESHGLMALDTNGDEVAFEDIQKGMDLKYMQPSGDDNALGLLKFETNSKENIYLHDTNEKNKFNFNTRIYSSGCIRVKDYLKLATLISNRPVEKIKEKINKGDMVFERTPTTPVYFTYSQVMFDVNGTPMYYADVYRKREHKKEVWK